MKGSERVGEGLACVLVSEVREGYSREVENDETKGQQMNMSVSIPVDHEEVTGNVTGSRECVHVHIEKHSRFDATRISLYGSPQQVATFLRGLLEQVEPIALDAWCEKTDSISN